MKKNIGVYIHIPFCKSKCYYCDFVSFSNKDVLIEEYIKAIIEEIKMSKIDEYNVKTVYIGGGTPSVLDSKYIGMILSEIRTSMDKEAEVTIEINPGTITKEKLIDYASYGINRVSIGLQSADDNLLKQIGRIHNYQEFLNTYKLVREVGINNINVDLILGLPNQSLEILKNSLNEVISLNPEHISIYSLILEEGTKLEEMVSNEELKLIDEDLERKMYWETKKILEQAGYEHYEISNYAKSRI